MVPLVTAEEMRALDAKAIEELGIPSLVLMETAGRAVANAARELLAERGGGDRILVVAGLGNNGGDAVVAARLLMNQGLQPTLVVAGDRAKASPDLARQLSIVEKLGLEPIVLTDRESELPMLFAGHSVAVDGLFGTGLERPVEGLAERVIQALNQSGIPVVAVDIPSGVDSDTGQPMGAAVQADVTVTFGLPKIGHALQPGRRLAGETRVIDIGIPYAFVPSIGPGAELLDEGVVEQAISPRDPNSHKGTFGHLFVVAGTPDRPGAAMLVSRAALRIGAGLVTLGSDDETIRRLAPAFDEVMGLSLGSPIRAERIFEALETRTALAIGPSLPADDDTARFIRDVVERAQVPAVVDAGALTVLGPDPRWMQARTFATVLTPHPGEAAHILGSSSAEVQKDRLAAARAIADTTGAVVVLKGASTVIAEPDGKVGVVTKGNPAMATAGTGDVLTGVIGGLLAQGIDAPVAARAGAWLHAVAGDKVAAQRGEGHVIASDLIAALAGRDAAK